MSVNSVFRERYHASGLFPTEKRRFDSLRRAIVLFFYAVTFVALIALLVRGFDYYSTPYGERPHHVDYRILRPAGSLGLLCGYIGASMMILMLTYTLRKRTKLLGRLFTLRGWLTFHIYLGICGPLFIVLHTSFKVQGLVAVSFWSMVAVALSGIFGRYLYLQIPRNIQGDELTLRDTEKITNLYASRLQEEYGLTTEHIRALDQVGQLQINETTSLWTVIREILKHNLTGHRRIHQEFEQTMRALKVQGGRLKNLLSLIEQRNQLQRRIVLMAHFHQLFHYWHVIHKPFAIIMYIIMMVHIGVAIWTGYGWNF